MLFMGYALAFGSCLPVGGADFAVLLCISSGVLNQHPRSVIAFNASDDRGDIVKFYDMVTEEE